MYAVIEAGGKQYRVQPGEKLRVEKMEAEPGAQVTFPVLLLCDGTNVRVGTPLVKDAQVVASVVGNEKGEKLFVYKFRKRKGYRRKFGHRQTYTALTIVNIKA
jgi:large subunit ribosomal protein L21